MMINKVWIRDLDIPIKNGTIRWLNIGGKLILEVELDVHPTVANFIDISGFYKERVKMILENDAEIVGKFSIHTGISGILLTRETNEVVGAEKYIPFQSCKSTFVYHSNKECSLNNELKPKQRSILITFLTSLQQSEIEDEGNQAFIRELIEKLKNDMEPSTFDRYLMDEILYLIEEAVNESQVPPTNIYKS